MAIWKYQIILDLSFYILFIRNMMNIDYILHPMVLYSIQYLSCTTFGLFVRGCDVSERFLTVQVTSGSKRIGQLANPIWIDVLWRWLDRIRTIWYSYLFNTNLLLATILKIDPNKQKLKNLPWKAIILYK